MGLSVWPASSFSAGSVVKSYLNHSGYDVFEAYNGKQVLELFIRVNPSLIILDLMLPDMAGEDILKGLDIGKIKHR